MTRTALGYLARLITAAVVVQFFLAGAGAFGASSYSPHKVLGTLLLVLALLDLLLALVARSFVRPSAVLLLVVTLQVALGVLGSDTSAWFGAVHAVNALAVLGAAGNLARRTLSPNRHTRVAAG